MDELTPLASDPPFLYSDVKPRPGALPPRYTGPVPHTRDGWYDRSGPPRWYIEDRLRAGDAAMIARVEEALARVPEWSDWLASSYARLLARTLDTPAVLAWFEAYVTRSATPPDVSPELLSAVVLERRYVFPGGSDAAQVLWEAAEDHLDALVKRVGVTAPATEAWTERRAPLPVASADPAETEDDLFTPPPLDAREWADANQAVRLRPGAARELVKAVPDRIVEVAVALECMATDSACYDFERRRALLELADLALDEARSLANGERCVALEPVAALLRRFANAGEIAACLHEVGLLEDPGLVAPDDPRGWCLPHLLWRNIVTFDTKTGCFPNEHDEMLHRVARVAQGALSDVLFEEIPPRGEDDEGDDDEDDAAPHGTPPDDAYVVRVYADGRVWEVRLEASGHYDVDGMLGVLNIVSRDLGREVRFCSLPHDDPYACILAAPIASIERAVAAGVLVLDPPPPIDD